MFWKPKSDKKRIRREIQRRKIEIDLSVGNWLTANVYCQGLEQLFGDLLQTLEIDSVVDMPVRLVHAINFFSKNGELDEIQLATARTTSLAAASDQAGLGNTTLLQVTAQDDPLDCLPGFTLKRTLDRDIRDIGNFDRPRPLPLLFDILDQAAEMASDEDFIVYTNADICLQPHFYGVVRSLLSAGFDAMTINRKTVGKSLLGKPNMLLQAEAGLNHPGFDCLVFSKKAYRTFARTDSCLGIKSVDRPLVLNMVALSDRMLMLTNATLTYHFGNDQSWTDPAFEDYSKHNEDETISAVDRLKQTPAVRERLEEFVFKYPGSQRVLRSFLD